MNMADPNNYEEELIQIKENIEETYRKLCVIWDEIGFFPENKREENKSAIISSCVEKISNHLNSIYENELQKRDECLENIKQEIDGVNSLCLKIGIDVWKKADGTSILEGVPLKVQLSIVKKRRSDLANDYANRKIKSMSVLEKLKSLYVELGEKIEDIFLNPDAFLTDEQMTILENRYEKLNTLKQNRRTAVTELSSMLLTQYTTLGIDLNNTTNDVDRIVLSNPSNIPITTLMLLQIEKRLNEVKELRNERIRIYSENAATIDSLWKLLQTPQDQIDEYNSKCSSTLSNEQQQYVDKLQQEVQIKLKDLIPSIRDDIYNIIDYMNSYTTTLQSWDLSILSIPEDQFSMELFEKHNELYEQLIEQKQILDTVVMHINKRNHLLELKNELDILMKDPSRYTDRRNSNKLLNRQRALEKEVRLLSVINNELIPIIGDYELHHGEIIIDGQHFLDTLKEEEALKPRSVRFVMEGIKCRLFLRFIQGDQ